MGVLNSFVVLCLLATTSAATTPAATTPAATTQPATTQAATTPAATTQPATTQAATTPAATTQAATTQATVVCLEGYYLKDDACVKMVKVFKSKLKLKRAFTPQLNNPSSPEFKNLANEVGGLLLTLLKAQNPLIEAVEVTGFTSGSVIVAYNVIITDPAGATVSAVDMQSNYFAVFFSLASALGTDPNFSSPFDDAPIVYGTVAAQSTSSDDGGAVEIECSQTTLTATVNRTMFNTSAGMGEMKIMMEGCSEGASGYQVAGNVVTSDFGGDCAYNITQNDDVIIQEAVLVIETAVNDTNSVVQRLRKTSYSLKCSFDRKLNVSIGQGSEVTEDLKEFEKRERTNFNASMNFYTDKLFSTEAASPLEVTDFEPIYIQVSALEDQSLYKFVVEDCYATPSADPNDATRYLYHDDKCNLDSTMKEYSDHNTETQYSHSIDAFRFIKIKGTVFFHCKLLICKSDSTAAECQQQCADQKRKRRSIGGDALEEIVVNTGAVRYRSKPTCETMQCPSNSECFDVAPATCRCVEGFVFNRYTKTCENGHLLTLNNLHMDQEFLPTYADTSSPDFIRLAALVERRLMTSYNLNGQKIWGVKVLSARQGSVVVNIQILHSPAMSTREAFDSFVASVVKSSQNTELLRVKQQITPTFIDLTDTEEVTSTLTLVLAVVVPSVALLVVVTMFLWCRSRDGRSQEKTMPGYYDNHAVSMNHLS